MENSKYIIVLRHGPTNSNETINYSKFISFVTNLINYLKETLGKANIDIKKTSIKVYASPYERCIDTAKLVTSYLNVLRSSSANKIEIKSNDKIKRWNSSKESRQHSIDRANIYGKHIYKKASTKPENICIYVTHSSIIPSFVSGIMGEKMPSTKLHSACMSIINVNGRKLETYNKSFDK